MLHASYMPPRRYMHVTCQHIHQLTFFELPLLKKLLILSLHGEEAGRHVMVQISSRDLGYSTCSETDRGRGRESEVNR